MSVRISNLTQGTPTPSDFFAYDGTDGTKKASYSLIENKADLTSLNKNSYGELSGGKNLAIGHSSAETEYIFTDIWNTQHSLYVGCESIQQTITLSFDAKCTSNDFLYCKVAYSDGTIGSELDLGSVGTSYATHTKVLSSQTGIRGIYIGVNHSEYTSYAKRVQIELGSTATSYEPYFKSNKQLDETKAEKEALNKYMGGGWNQLIELSGIGGTSQTIYGVTITKNADGSLTLNGTCNDTANVIVLGTYSTTYGHKCYISSGSSNINVALETPWTTGTNFIATVASSAKILLRITQGQVFNNDVCKPMLIDLNSLGLDNITTPSQFRALYSADYYPWCPIGGDYVRQGGRFLGTSYTAEQQAAVSSGTFAGLEIGDYWTIGGHNWRIWGIDWYLNKGDLQCTAHHLVIMPDDNLLDADGSTHYMQDTNDTTGAYASTKYRNQYRSGCEATINSCFGNAHILSHRELIANATSGGGASGWEWYDASVEIPSEVMMYGSTVWSNGGYNTGSAYPQLALARIKPSAVVNRENYWLRDVVSASCFARVYSNGGADRDVASDPWFGVRPYFLLKG